MALRDEIIWRSGVVYLFITITGIAILARILIIQFLQGDEWAELGEEFVYKTDVVPANRGDLQIFYGVLHGFL